MVARAPEGELGGDDMTYMGMLQIPPSRFTTHFHVRLRAVRIRCQWKPSLWAVRLLDYL